MDREGEEGYLEDLLPKVFAVYPSRHGEDRRGLSRTRRSIEQKMRQPVLLDELLDYKCVIDD